jgi:flagellar motor switch protein FliN/FliY
MGFMIDRSRSAGDEVELWIELGRAQVPLSQAKSLGPRSVVSLDALADETVSIFIAGRLVARGEVLELDGHYCVRVTELVGGNAAA